MLNSVTQFFDLKIFNRSKKELFKYLKEDVLQKKSQKLTVLFTPNAEHIVLAEKDALFKKHLQQADILIADGTSLVFASKIFAAKTSTDESESTSPPFQERITGIDLVQDLLKLAQEKKWRVLVLGGRDLDAETADTPASYSWLEGYKNVFQPTEKEEKHVAHTLHKLQPQIVFVAFGAPSQEKWVVEHRQLLEKNGVKLAMVVGGAFDVLTGKVARAPQWMQAMGLEWLFRLIQEPWRWRRQTRLFRFWKMVFEKM